MECLILMLDNQLNTDGNFNKTGKQLMVNGLREPNKAIVETKILQYRREIFPKNGTKTSASNPRPE